MESLLNARTGLLHEAKNFVQRPFFVPLPPLARPPFPDKRGRFRITAYQLPLFTGEAASVASR